MVCVLDLLVANLDGAFLSASWKTGGLAEPFELVILFGLFSFPPSGASAERSTEATRFPGMKPLNIVADDEQALER